MQRGLKRGDPLFQLNDGCHRHAQLRHALAIDPVSPQALFKL
jgi:hypothetical protein